MQATIPAPTLIDQPIRMTPEIIAQLQAAGIQIPDALLQTVPAADLELVPSLPELSTQQPAPSTSPAPTTADKLRAMMTQRSGGAGLMGAIDLSQAHSKNYRLLPIDTPIEAQIASLTIGKSNSGNDMLTLGLKTTYPVEYAGVDLTDFVILDPHDPKRSWKFRSLCEACTTEIEVDGQAVEVPLLYEERYIGDDEGKAFLGNIIQFVADHNEYPEGSGKVYNKVKGSYLPGKLTPGL